VRPLSVAVEGLQVEAKFSHVFWFKATSL
jgi:hypothetical protein